MSGPRALCVQVGRASKARPVLLSAPGAVVRGAWLTALVQLAQCNARVLQLKCVRLDGVLLRQHLQGLVQRIQCLCINILMMNTWRPSESMPVAFP